MNLLISVSFDENIKDNFINIIENLKKCSRKGRFNVRGNLRMNFLSLDDIDDIRPIQKALEKLNTKEFKIKFVCLDKSRREGGDIYWAMAEQCPELTEIYGKMVDMAEEYEYEYSKKPFKPRVQLGQKVIARPNFVPDEFEVTVNNISIVKYTELKGKTVYKEIYRKQLKNK